MEQLAYSPKDAAEKLGMSRGAIYRLLTDGTLPSVKIGKARRIRAEALTSLLDRLEGRDEVAERVTSSRLAQGLPPKVEDDATIRRVANLAAQPGDDHAVA